MTEVPEDLRRAKQAIEDKLLARPGVTGVDIGPKIVGGRPTDQLAIRVLVERKRDDVPDDERIPGQVGDYPTDVLQRRYVLHATTGSPDPPAPAPPLDRMTYHPLLGGISIGPCRQVDGQGFVGTLGAIVRDTRTGAPMLLGNYHVFALDEDGAPGDALAQPGPPDGGACPQFLAGWLVRSSVGGEVDCAVAAPSRPVVRWIADIGPIAGTAKPAIGQRVRKRGRTTGVTYGTIDTIDLTQQISFGTELVTLTNQINVIPDTTRNAQFGARGDSGAVLVTDDNEIVGLYMAGDEESGNGIANPIASVLSALDVELATGVPAGPPAPCGPAMPSPGRSAPCAPPGAGPPPPCSPPPWVIAPPWGRPRPPGPPPWLAAPWTPPAPCFPPPWEGGPPPHAPPWMGPPPCAPPPWVGPPPPCAPPPWVGPPPPCAPPPWVGPPPPWAPPAPCVPPPWMGGAPWGPAAGDAAAKAAGQGTSSSTAPCDGRQRADEKGTSR